MGLFEKSPIKTLADFAIHPVSAESRVVFFTVD